MSLENEFIYTTNYFPKSCTLEMGNQLLHRNYLTKHWWPENPHKKRFTKAARPEQTTVSCTAFFLSIKHKTQSR